MQELFGLKKKLDELNKVFAPLVQKDKQVIKDPKVRYTENEVQNLKTQLQEIIGEIKAAWHNWDEKNKTTGFGLQEDELAELLERGKMTGFGGLVVDKNGNGIGHWVADNIDERY